MPKLTHEQAMAIMKASLAPLVCLPKEDDYGDKIVMEVITTEDTTIFSCEFSRKQFSDEIRLRGILNGLRREIEGKRYL